MNHDAALATIIYDKTFEEVMNDEKLIKWSEVNEILTFADCWNHFRCQEFAFYHLVSLREKYNVACGLNFFCEQH